MLRTNQTAKKYGTKRSNMSKVMNEGVRMHCKSVMANLFTLVGLLVETSTAIQKKGSLEASIFISTNYITVTYSSPVIPPLLVRRDVCGGGDGSGVVCPP